MTALDRRLADLLGPVRDQCVGAMLDALATAIDSGAEVEAEPLVRDASGRPVRDGPLGLPRRTDLGVTRGGRRLPRRIESAEVAGFAPITLVAEGGFTTVVCPFRWEAAEILLETRQSLPDWTPLRHWFLEGVQGRMIDVSPDLTGALHALDGPREGAQGLRLTVDFGSAPLSAFAGLMAAVSESGCLRMRVGQDL